MSSLFWLTSLVAFLILLSLVGYLLVALFGYLLRSRPTARKVVQVPVTVLLSVAIGISSAEELSVPFSEILAGLLMVLERP